MKSANLPLDIIAEIRNDDQSLLDLFLVVFYFLDHVLEEFSESDFEIQVFNAGTVCYEFVNDELFETAEEVMKDTEQILSFMKNRLDKVLSLDYLLFSLGKLTESTTDSDGRTTRYQDIVRSVFEKRYSMGN